MTVSYDKFWSILNKLQSSGFIFVGYLYQEMYLYTHVCFSFWKSYF